MSRMKNIEAILKEYGFEIPEDKKEEFRKTFHENYKTVVDYGKIETDRDSWKERAETAETTLKGFEGIDPTKVQEELDTWKKKAEDAEKNYNDKIYERDFSDSLKTELESYKFSSEAAKKAVMAEIKEAGLKLKDGKILGLSDLIAQIKESDASAFVDDEQVKAENNKARFTTSTNMTGGKETGKVTKQDIMAIKDPTDRQKAIKENIGLFWKGE